MTQPRLPLPQPRQRDRSDTRTARIVAFGVGRPPVTCEVEFVASGERVTIWFRGYSLGETVTLEQRMGSGGLFWADVNDAGGPTRS